MFKSLKRKWLPPLIACFVKALIRLIYKSCKVNVTGIEKFIETAKEKPCILMLWHNRLILTAEVFKNVQPVFTYTAFISKSRDGDPLASFAKSYPNCEAIRVAHNARHAALKEMIDCLKAKSHIVLITPDGPRGPRYKVKNGVLMAAEETEAAVVPFSWQASRFWELSSWDKFQIPKPFSTINVVIGEPEYPHAWQLSEEQKLERLEHALNTSFVDK